MKATEAKLLDFLRKSPQFVIPIYQRTYSWTEKECKQLWDDIVSCGKNDRTLVHFIGSIVYIQNGLSQVTHQSSLLVIDGQQRLTTITLLLSALANAVGSVETIDGFTQRKICNYYLLNPEEEGDRHFKLLLSQADKQTLTSLVKGDPQPENNSLRVSENHSLFTKWIKNGDVDLQTICKGISKLVVVDIALDREQDDPQLIFESMNSTGKELSQADLIRNFILMGLEPKQQTELYEKYWHPMESQFGQEAYGTHFDLFIRHYLTVISGQIPNINAVYETFKAHARKMRNEASYNETYVESIVKTLRDYSRYFCAISLGNETDKELRRAFHDLCELKVDVANPFIMELYHDYASGLLSKEDFIQIIQMVESYVFRRAVCEIPSNSMNKTFATFSKSLKKDLATISPSFEM